MNTRARAFGTTTVAAFALAIGLAGCSTLPDPGTTASGGVFCLDLRSTVTNLEALRAWCLDHHDAAAAVEWVNGIENSLKAETPGDAATASRLHDAAAELDEQVRALSGPDGDTAIAQLPGVITDVLGKLTPTRDAVCA
ncbi:hypothetical protein [Leifsonia virtsii]|uniref:Lipoprotein n=1 Tax=Leifsonia virtsii TaxID=3035915 RepID=A0ABT8IT54_9MICO|nr:hypothetical protein [Leifsonia virtsii]MDN4595958.1 hypothetical protein [Leifsonia virtsii]